ncbi:MAG: hypothetical protein EAZ13_09365 [Sphingobacteriia bacterium]|nr:MAG: hypothetical protein EAZ13_09365 [Sphingobacteriia bacterium]
MLKNNFKVAKNGYYGIFYNHKRLHGSLKMQTPQSVWNNWYEQNNTPTKGLKNIKKNNSNNQKCQPFDKI